MPTGNEFLARRWRVTVIINMRMTRGPFTLPELFRIIEAHDLGVTKHRKLAHIHKILRRAISAGIVVKRGVRGKPVYFPVSEA